MYSVLRKSLLACLSALFVLGIDNVCKAAGNAANGGIIFQQCQACHSPQQGVNLIGPNLFEVVGRRAGSIPGYEYSQAMQEAAEKGLVWTPENIAAYLQNPHKFLDDFAGDPGAPNKMPFFLTDAKEREDVVSYLESRQKK